MKFLVGVFLCFTTSSLLAQTDKADNVFIITTDGFRWQEVFNGADSMLINDANFVKDVSLTKELYWDPNPEVRRKKLMPFFWNVLAKQGQLYGNRSIDSKVNVANIYKISYPGYNELLTGFADPLPVLNSPLYNPNISVLEYLNQQPKYAGKVVAFSSWNVFPFILNKNRNGIFQNSGYESMQSDSSESLNLLNAVQEKIEDKYHTRYDLLTFFNAKEYVKQHHPKVVFISFGETDEFAHKGQYDLYLQQAANVDKMISELWYFIQTDSFYKNNTTLLISTDHGRGKKVLRWTDHHALIRGSGEIWLGMLGKGIAPGGEMHHTLTIYQKQVAATVASLLGETFISNHSVAPPVKLPVKINIAATAISVPEKQSAITVGNK